MLGNNKTMQNKTDKILPIGFFDSGVGGLSVYSLFKKSLPYENTLYFGDLKNMPYGNKSKDELLGFARRILNFFESQKVKAVVIACNTSSATVYDTIKDEYDFKIYPIIQSSAEVISKMNIKKVGVFATLATINSGAYKREIQKHNPKMEVAEHACPNWTSFVEGGQINTPECLADVKSHFEEISKSKPDKIILGCTHYPFLLPVLRQFAEAELFIDPAKIFVDFIRDDLNKLNLLSNSSEKGAEKFFVSANPDDFVKNAKLFYEVKNLPVVI